MNAPRGAFMRRSSAWHADSSSSAAQGARGTPRASCIWPARKLQSCSLTRPQSRLPPASHRRWVGCSSRAQAAKLAGCPQEPGRRVAVCTLPGPFLPTVQCMRGARGSPSRSLSVTQLRKLSGHTHTGGLVRTHRVTPLPRQRGAQAARWSRTRARARAVRARVGRPAASRASAPAPRAPSAAVDLAKGAVAQQDRAGDLAGQHAHGGVEAGAAHEQRQRDERHAQVVLAAADLVRQ